MLNLISLISTLAGILLTLGVLFASSHQWLDFLCNFMYRAIAFQARFNIKLSKKNNKIRMKTEEELREPKLVIQYWWLEHRLAAIKTSGRQANEHARKHRIKFDLEPLQIVDKEGYLVEDLVRENKQDIEGWLESLSTLERPNKTPKIVFQMGILATIFFSFAAISSYFS